MGILGRLSTLIKSNVNDAIDSMQDPAKEIDQMVRDMEQAAREARSEVAASIAERKKLAKRVEALEAEAKQWEGRAETAVRAGDDALAREALKRKADKENEKLETEKALQEQVVNVDKLNAALKALDERVRDVKVRQGGLRERARMAKKGPGGSSLSTKSSAFDDFDRMSQKIEEVEVAANLDEELGGRSAESLAAERRLNEMSREGNMDDALAELKKKLGK